MPERSACAGSDRADSLQSDSWPVVQLCLPRLKGRSPVSVAPRRPFKIVQQAKPSIVNIHGQKTLAPGDENYRRGEAQNVNGMGTGVIIDERGYILTNHHVVDGVSGSK